MNKHVQQIMNRCKFFTGTQNEVCKKGVRYIDVRDSTKSPYAWPCLHDVRAATCCVHAEYPTREEAEAEENKIQEAIAEHLACIAGGKCPHCKQIVTQRQVGSCVYGSCGHRMYQGKVNPEFAEDGKRPARKGAS